MEPSASQRLGGCRSLQAGLMVGDTSTEAGPLVTMAMIGPKQQTPPPCSAIRSRQITLLMSGKVRVHLLGSSGRDRRGLWGNSTPRGRAEPSHGLAQRVLSEGSALESRGLGE